MDEQTLKKLEEQDKKLDAIYKSIEKMRKYFLWTLIITVALVVIPLVAMIFVLPGFVSTYTTGLQ